MKYISFLFATLFIVSCSNEHIQEQVVTDVNLGKDRQNFIEEVGLWDLIVSQVQDMNHGIERSDAQPWIENYKSTIFNHPESEYLGIYYLTITKHMIKYTDFLDIINQDNAKFLMEVYNSFDTRFELGSKHKMLVKLAEYYPESAIQKLRDEAYTRAINVQEILDERLNQLNQEYKDLGSLNLWQETRLIEAKERVEELRMYLPYFEPAS